MSLSPDTQAILLLCSSLGQSGNNGADVLSVRQYSALARWLRDQALRPGDLLDEKGRRALRAWDASIVDVGKVTRLLERGAALAIAVERWESRGLWVISRSDPEYPASYKSYFGSEAPPVIYGAGNASLLLRQGLAIVGSRDAAEEDLQFAGAVARACARQRVAVISGGARGVDMTAMTAAFDEGGIAVGVLPDGLAKAAVSPRFREGLLSDRLVLISAVEPEARWFVYTAMQRNKLIYGLSAAALVVSSGEQEGGTWAGATEALKAGRIRVYVKASGTVSGGNRRLLRMGALPFPQDGSDDIPGLFAPVARPGDLFSAVKEAGTPESTAQPPGHGQEPPPDVDPVAPLPEQAREEIAADKAEPAGEVPAEPDRTRHDYALVLPEILRLLQEPRQPGWLVAEMGVQKKQMQAWLKRAQEEGAVRKINKKPVRYVAVSAQTSLFADPKH